MSIIQLQNISVDYGREKILDNVSLKVNEREFLGIIGPNGGGKTTLLKVMLGLISPNFGEVIISNNAKLGYVPQFTTFDKQFPIKVLDVILMGRLSGKLRPFQKYNKKDMQLAEKIMDNLGILEFRDRKINQLSGGQMQKVLIARTLVMEPQILLLDEPTASLDSSAKDEIYRLLKEINNTKTIIMVSHDTGVISSYVDTIACLNKKLFYHGKDSCMATGHLKKAYGCPIDFISHGSIPHRVLKNHKS